LCKLSQSIAQQVIHVHGHKVKLANFNNSAADCPISVKFRTEFDHGSAGTLQMFKVKGERSRSWGQSSRSQRNVTCCELQGQITQTPRVVGHPEILTVCPRLSLKRLVPQQQQLSPQQPRRSGCASSSNAIISCEQQAHESSSRESSGVVCDVDD